MKVNELTVGDWVSYHGIANKIAPADFCYNHKEWIDKIEPISITAEILEKNGFVANKHVYPYPYYEYINNEDKLKVGFAFPQGNRTSYKEPWVYIDSEHAFAEHLPCMFLHQLQQVMRFCGINKEIEL